MAICGLVDLYINITRDNITPNNIPSLIPIKMVTNKVTFKIIRSLKLNESNFFGMEKSNKPYAATIIIAAKTAFGK